MAGNHVSDLPTISRPTKQLDYRAAGGNPIPFVTRIGRSTLLAFASSTGVIATGTIAIWQVHLAVDALTGVFGLLALVGCLAISVPGAIAAIVGIKGPHPNWCLAFAIVCLTGPLFAIALVFSQPAMHFWHMGGAPGGF
jgi:hypothetical protein